MSWQWLRSQDATGAIQLRSHDRIDAECSLLSAAASLLIAGHVLRPPLTPMICPVM